MRNINRSVFVIAVGLLIGSPAQADRFRIDTEWFRLRVSNPTPSALAAFYEGRGFPKAMLDELRKACFINIGLGNISQTIVWFDLANFRFTTPSGELKRYTRDHWRNKWQTMQIELRHQSTFRWTLMPEQLDFRPSEGESGNIIFPFTNEPITITGTLAIGENKEKWVPIRFEEVRCAVDQPES